jgi:hypothetical protein
MTQSRKRAEYFQGQSMPMPEHLGVEVTSRQDMHRINCESNR